MDNFNDIKKIWLTANVSALPKPGEVVKTIKRYRVKHIIKNGALILFTLIMVAVICWVLFAYKSNLFVTKIGEAFFFIALFILLGTNVKSLSRISTQKNFSNGEFISFLKQEQVRQISFQKRTQVIGFALASTGLLLYIFEMVYQHTVMMIVTYLLTGIWIAVCWFVIRPLSIKRKTKKLTGTIEKLERLSTQLSNK